MLIRVVGVGVVIATVALLMWLAPFPIPDSTVIAFVLALFPMAVVLSVKRMRQESRLARATWLALTRK